MKKSKNQKTEESLPQIYFRVRKVKKSSLEYRASNRIFNIFFQFSLIIFLILSVNSSYSQIYRGFDMGERRTDIFFNIEDIDYQKKGKSRKDLNESDFLIVCYEKAILLKDLRKGDEFFKGKEWIFQIDKEIPYHYIGKYNGKKFYGDKYESILHFLNKEGKWKKKDVGSMVFTFYKDYIKIYLKWNNSKHKAWIKVEPWSIFDN